GLRILSGGSRIWWFQYRGPSGSRMVKIGVWPSVKLDPARKRAHILAGEVAHGQDPAAERKTERMRSESTLRILLAEGGPYQRELERRDIVNVKPALSSLRRGLHRLMGKEVAALTRADLVTAIGALQTAGKPGAAQDLRKASRGLLEWAVSTGRASHNVLAG